MCEGFPASEGDDSASGLDEFLCEYVDGTMDPVVRKVFDEYLRQNPHLIEHIECLRRTRTVLCRYGCKMRAPDALQERLHARLARESVSPAPHMPGLALNLQWMVGFSSILLLAFGLMAGGGSLPDAADESPLPTPKHQSSVVATVESVPTYDGLSSASLVGVPLVSRRALTFGLADREPVPTDTFLTTKLSVHGTE